MEGSLVFLDQVKGADAGQFTITDILGFTVSSIHLEVQRKDGDGAEKSAKWRVYIAVMAAKGSYANIVGPTWLFCG